MKKLIELYIEVLNYIFAFICTYWCVVYTYAVKKFCTYDSHLRKWQILWKRNKLYIVCFVMIQVYCIKKWCVFYLLSGWYMSKRLCFQQNATLKCSCGCIFVNTMSDLMLDCIRQKRRGWKSFLKIYSIYGLFFFKPDNGKLDLGGVKYV